MIWFWGSDAGNNSNTPLCITITGNYANLNTTGLFFANTSANPLSTSVRPYKLVNKVCSTASVVDVNPESIKIINRTDFIEVKSDKATISSVEIYDALGRNIYKKQNINDTSIRIEKFFFNQPSISYKSKNNN